MLIKTPYHWFPSLKFEVLKTIAGFTQFSLSKKMSNKYPWEKVSKREILAIYTSKITHNFKGIVDITQHFQYLFLI